MIRASEKIHRAVATSMRRMGTGSSAPASNRRLSSLDSKREQREDCRSDRNALSSPFQWPTLAAAADPVATTTAVQGALDPVWQHFLETLITWGVPTSVLALAVAGGVAAARRRPRAAPKRRDRAKDPAAELYDDLYATAGGGKKRRGLAEELRDLVRELTSRGGDEARPSQLLRENRGIPAQQFIALTHVNRQLESYQYSVACATRSKSLAAARYRQQSFDRALSAAVLAGGDPDAIAPSTRARLLESEREFLQAGSKLVRKIQARQTELTRGSIKEEMKAMGVTPFQVDPPDNNKDTPKSKVDKQKQTQPESKDNAVHWKELQEAQRKLMELELQFIRNLVAALGPQRASAIKVALVGDVRARGTGGLLTQLQQRPLATILPVLLEKNPTSAHAGAATSGEEKGGEDRVSTSDAATLNTTNTTNNEAKDATAGSKGERGEDWSSNTSNANTSSVANLTNNIADDEPGQKALNAAASPRPRLFVMRFPGDTGATQVAKLREEVTAIVRSAAVGDEALVILESSGGTVTGYGLAAGQLQRLRAAGLRLTVAAEQVAASGGYLMCCVGDRIVGSPFCVFGSIGVVTEIPNVHGRLKREGV